MAAQRPPHVSSVTLNDLTFDASFDSGNAARVEAAGGPDEFNIWTTIDCQGTPFAKLYKVWFSFSIKACNSTTSASLSGRVLTFHIFNMNNLGKLFKFDMRPVYRYLPSKPKWSRLNNPTSQTGTQKGDENFVLSFRHKMDCGSGDRVQFAFCFPLSYTDSMARLAWIDALFQKPPANVLPPSVPLPSLQQSSSTSTAAAAAAAAAAAPAAAAAEEADEASGGGGGGTTDELASLGRRLSETLKLVPNGVYEAALAAACSASSDGGASGVASQLDAELAEAGVAFAAAQAPPGSTPPKGIYYHRELLTRSLDGRRVDLLTISGTNGMLESYEAPLDAYGEGLMPEGGERPRAFAPSKPVFLMSARVHPGETPASHVFEGLLELLLRENDPRAKALRERFVFKLIPMVNPDGVFRGHYRADTLGHNLNRCYGEATKERHPTVYAIAAVVRQLHAEGRLKFYIDTHAHATKRGCFLYGNALPDEATMVENVLYARVVAANTKWFDFAGCCFTEKNMYRADQRDGLSKAGSGRVSVYKATGLTYVYTLECSYNTGRLVNRLQPLHVPKGQDKRKIEALSPPPPPSRSAMPKYTPDSWRSVGRALAISALDVVEANPCSRLGAPGGNGLKGLRGFIGAWVRTQAKKAEEKAAAAAKKGGGGDAGDAGAGGDAGGAGSGGSGDEDDGDEPELRGEEEAGLSDEEEEPPRAPPPAAAPAPSAPPSVGKRVLPSSPSSAVAGKSRVGSAGPARTTTPAVSIR